MAYDKCSDPECQGQNTTAESLTYAYLSNTKKSPSVEGKIAQLINDMFIDGSLFDTVKESPDKYFQGIITGEAS